MIFFFAILGSILRATWRSTLSLTDTGTIDARASLFHAEARFVQQAYYPHYFELGRWDFGVRIGMVALMIRKRWVVTVGGQAITYKRPLARWQRFQLQTRMVGYDAQYLYFGHTIVSGGKTATRGLVRLSCRDGRRAVPPSEIFEALGVPPPSLPDMEPLNRWKALESSWTD